LQKRGRFFVVSNSELVSEIVNHMEITDLKTEIHRIVDELPENQLVEVRKLLQQKQQESVLSPEEQKLVRKIFTEDRGLLQRLAQ